MKKNAYIQLENVSINFPVLHAASQSIKNRVIGAVTGGFFNHSPEGQLVVEGLKNINLNIRKGERVGLVGHNGAGKSTMLRVLAGIYEPVIGKIEIQGDAVSLINIGLGIDPEASGLENIKLRAAMMGLQPGELDNCIDEIVEFSGLGEFIHMPFRTYSSGMQMRLAFSVSTTVRPQILIMDEWLSLGDSEFAERAKKRMDALVESTEILILASHSKDLLVQNCTRLIWLEHGVIKMDGSVEEVSTEYFG
ncbi:ATP-binding ABC transporter [Vibrio nigripulchritudo MADA3029]|uniref:ABC transporter ATP-binding protein n=1 Tax=Vibrio nigripulchritudo TaxID=28173 RepID=UPI0003B216F6|nr:ABC transporter ATP-binding protein [Vibrio nigripulchritudo]CCN47638.1 ATP-binding ABC transporter [Vibrio nigripulchritudo MADA3020]CCN56539.1 ATP-binding ABC transporter [Vibrio nigripulchritudo MADA3021]CCN58837.1 ATP-binding ABC transporter [Vibrio nigripulchritudo MADA3029]